MPAALAAQSPRHWAPGKSHGLSCPQSSQGRVPRPLLSQDCWAFAKPPPTQGGSAGWLPTALHVLWGQVLKIWEGGGLGLWGQLGKHPGRSWALEEPDRVGEAPLDAPGRSPGQRVWRQAGLRPTRQAPPAQGRGARQGRLPCASLGGSLLGAAAAEQAPPALPGMCRNAGRLVSGRARAWLPPRRALLQPSPIRLRPPIAPQKPVWTSPSRPLSGTGSHLVTCSRSTAAGPLLHSACL